MEEISQLESGSTYRVVYHGMWKGTDVAIKRIKGSCFARKSSETERMVWMFFFLFRFFPFDIVWSNCSFYHVWYGQIAMWSYLISFFLLQL